MEAGLRCFCTKQLPCFLSVPGATDHPVSQLHRDKQMEIDKPTDRASETLTEAGLPVVGAHVVGGARVTLQRVVFALLAVGDVARRSRDRHAICRKQRASR